MGSGSQNFQAKGKFLWLQILSSRMERFEWRGASSFLTVLGVHLRGLRVTLRIYLIYIGVIWRLGAGLDGMDIMDGIFPILVGGEGNLPVPAVIDLDRPSIDSKVGRNFLHTPR